MKENGREVLEERYALVTDRIRKIGDEHFGEEKLEKYFAFCADFLLMIEDTGRFLAEGGLEKAPVEELRSRNHALYEDILPGHYEKSYGNPSYAAQELGEELGALLSFLYTELRSLIGFIYEGRLEAVVVRMELFAEVYAAFAHAAAQGEELPSG